MSDSSSSFKNLPGILMGNLGERDQYIEEIGGKAGSEKTFAKFTFKNGSESNLERANRENINYSKNNTDFSKEESIIEHYDFSYSIEYSNYIIYPFPSELETFINTGVFYLTENDSSGFDYKTFLESIPCAQIRAYEPYTVMQYVQGLSEVVCSAIEYGSNTSAAEIIKDFLKACKSAFTEVGDFFSALIEEKSREAFKTEFANQLSNFKFSNGRSIGNYDFEVLDLPWNLYYKVVGSYTNAIYEIPCLFPSDHLNSDGNYGWSNDLNNFKLTSLIHKSNNLSEKSNIGGTIFSSILALLASKMNLTIMPFFNPSNSSGIIDGVDISFDLVNDTIEHATNNFAFVQTITANNKWIQSTIFTRPANLYDVLIPGGTRLFMCTGNFTISLKGAVRTFKKSTLDYFHKQPFGEEIRIPEAYSIKIRFESLLPNNFNTYMMGMLKANENMFEYNHGKREEGGALEKITDAFISGTVEMKKTKDLVDSTKIAEEYIKNNKSVFENNDKKDEFIKTINSNLPKIIACKTDEEKNKILKSLFDEVNENS